MAAPQFHETVMGHRFFVAQLPALINGINRLADSQAENTNQLVSLMNTMNQAINPNPSQTTDGDTSVSGMFPPISAESKNRLLAVLADTEKAEALGDTFYNAVTTDTEPSRRSGYYLARAVLDGNIDDLLVAVCGWRIETLLDMADNAVSLQLTDSDKED